jgi:hypothetical protein
MLYDTLLKPQITILASSLKVGVPSVHRMRWLLPQTQWALMTVFASVKDMIDHINPNLCVVPLTRVGRRFGLTKEWSPAYRFEDAEQEDDELWSILENTATGTHFSGQDKRSKVEYVQIATVSGNNASITINSNVTSEKLLPSLASDSGKFQHTFIRTFSSHDLLDIMPLQFFIFDDVYPPRPFCGDSGCVTFSCGARH